MGQEWEVGWAVHVIFDPHSHRVPCPVPAPGGPSHPFPRQPPPQPLPSHHLPSILLTAARQVFEKLKLGRVTCLMCLATLKSKTQAPHWPQRPTPSSLRLLGPHLSSSHPRPQPCLPAPAAHPLPRFHSAAPSFPTAMPLLLVIPASTQTSHRFSREPCPAPLPPPRPLTLSDCISIERDFAAALFSRSLLSASWRACCLPQCPQGCLAPDRVFTDTCAVGG